MLSESWWGFVQVLPLSNEAGISGSILAVKCLKNTSKSPHSAYQDIDKNGWPFWRAPWGTVVLISQSGEGGNEGRTCCDKLKDAMVLLPIYTNEPAISLWFALYNYRYHVKSCYELAKVFFCLLLWLTLTTHLCILLKQLLLCVYRYCHLNPNQKGCKSVEGLVKVYNSK